MRCSMTKPPENNADTAVLPEPVRAEAAVWLARLHSDQRSEETERSFRAWLAGDAVRAAAFERMTNTWEATGALRQSRIEQAPCEPPALAQETSNRRRYLLAAAAMLLVSVVIGFGALVLPTGIAPTDQVIETALGERRSLQLDDGSRLVLNTDSRVAVTFSSSMRLVTLQRGQARFEVAKDAARPFVVRAGGKQIVARGTEFDVRWTDQRLSVVLFEGRVSVMPETQRPSAEGISMQAGERLYFAQPALAVKSSSSLDREAAWLAGRAVFDETPLREAIAEMNRYTRRPVELGDPALADMQISGTFSVDDVDAFARALADVFSLQIESSNTAILLTRARI